MLSLCHININSITKHKDELLARFSKYDIISVNETNLKSERPFTLFGYNIFRNDRIGQAGGGVLLAVKQHIKCQEVINKITCKNEAIAVEIRTKSFKSILISSIYVPPKAKIDINLFHELYNINNNCIIMGDLNATLYNMGSQQANARGRQLRELFKDGLIDCVEDDSPTFKKNDYEVKLDWILASQPLLSFISNVETHPTIGALNGHKPLTFDIPCGAEPKPASSRISFNFKAAKWSKFRCKLDQQLMLWKNDHHLDSIADIEEHTSFITTSILEATKEAVPQTKQMIRTYTPSEVSISLIKQKHQAYRKWKKTGNNLDKHLYYNSKVLLTNSLRNDRRNNFNKLMSSLCHKKMYSDKVWLTVRRFHNKRIKQTYAHIMKYNNTTATSDKEKADLFADYFENEVYSHTADTLPLHDQVTRQANKVKSKTITSSDTPKWKQIKEKEVKNHIRQLRNSSTGPDNIHNRCLKNHSKLLVQHLTNLFNAILKQGYIPAMWKKANIILLLKPKKDKQQPSSYRPISLLSCLGKLLEKIIKQRLMLELERRNILPQHQAGFRPGKSTIYNIVRLERYAAGQLRRPRRRRHSAVILFDIKAAFDSVWHDGLIYKLNGLRLPCFIINYLISFLSNRTAAIEIENILSRPFNLKSGTPQGSPLSPLLYIMYTADSMNGIPTHTEHGLFADDTALWISGNTLTNLNTRLQQSIDAFESWCKSWKLKLQPTKTELIHFSIHPRKHYKNPVKVKVEDTIIKPLDSTRYLGVIIDKRLKWRAHLEHIESKIAPRIGLLRYLSRTTYEPNNKTMINIFKSIVRTVIIYGHPILLTADQKVWDRLQIIQNKAIRAALGLPIYTSVKYIHKISNIPKIKDYAIGLLKHTLQKATTNNDITLKNHLQCILDKI
uniref:AP-like endonuclease/reverse transcriptase n=1 Tax=Adineta vaga TaxID=104782 RepID=D1D8L9_ADIVA|nr:AP-like endonuclease/reverse transcriptase [Adineta vaga]